MSIAQKPEDISNEVWERARHAINAEECAEGYVNFLHVNVARAILSAVEEEREAILVICAATISEDHQEASDMAAKKNFTAANHWNAHADGVEEIASAIRARKDQ